jgi:hypothetical protein
MLPRFPAPAIASTASSSNFLGAWVRLNPRCQGPSATSIQVISSRPNWRQFGRSPMLEYPPNCQTTACQCGPLVPRIWGQKTRGSPRITALTCLVFSTAYLSKRVFWSNAILMHLLRYLLRRRLNDSADVSRKPLAAIRGPAISSSGFTAGPRIKPAAFPGRQLRAGQPDCILRRHRLRHVLRYSTQRRTTSQTQNNLTPATIGGARF